MPVNIGDRFGHYDVIALLGEGGMGRVYRATDTKLRRDVALKIIPDSFVNADDRLARFEREAHVLASLNHPNIAAIYGVEEGLAEAGGHERALVLELVEGPTLADRIAQGPVPLDEALPIARQIAEALEAAHDAGVIHRDLKPANIKLRPDGTVKVLDFGLAKALAPDSSSATAGQGSQSPTVTSPAMTRAGVILGTAAYMSPEQARGDIADRRSDIWAFGCVLLEMLTGRRAFEGETVSDTLAAVLRAEPEWHRLPSNLHPRLRLLLERCLEKNGRNRYQGIGDARVDVQQVLADPHGRLLGHASDARSITPRRLLPWLAATALLTALLVGISAWTLRPSVPGLEGRLTYVLPDDQSFTAARHPLVAGAPDGSSSVYVANNRLFPRPIDELEARPIRGTEGRCPPRSSRRTDDRSGIGTAATKGSRGSTSAEERRSYWTARRSCVARAGHQTARFCMPRATESGVSEWRAETHHSDRARMGARAPAAPRRAECPVHTTADADRDELGGGGDCCQGSRERPREGPGSPLVYHEQ